MQRALYQETGVMFGDKTMSVGICHLAYPDVCNMTFNFQTLLI